MRTEPLLELIGQLYPETERRKSYEQFVRDTFAQHPVREGRQATQIIIGDPVRAHCLAIRDERNGMSMIGFLQATDAQSAHEALMRAQQTLTGRIYAPIDWSIWHNYRVVLDEQPTYSFDPLSKPAYADCLRAAGYEEYARYVTARRDDPATIREPTLQAYKHALAQGYELTGLRPEETDELRVLASKTFEQDEIMVPISQEEFADIYTGKHQHVRTIRKDGQILGFCFSYPEGDQRVIKSIGVHPAHQKSGLGAALLHDAHRHEKSYLYALIREGNTVTQLPYKGVRRIRSYALFSKVP